ncbi:rod shape-determining protein MreC [Candidatus Dependentiae bacterium]|nr:rod shape-determining protein MreC [Candidatus Dependentiae bacterium]
MKLSKKIILIGIITGSAIIMVRSPHDNILTNSVSIGYSYCVYPLLCINRYIVAPIEHYLHRFKMNQHQSSQITLLEQENTTLRARITELQASINYAEDIKELVAFRKQFDELNGQIASIMLKRLSDQEHYILVDQGSRHGIQTDMVAVYKNCLLGRVSEVYPLHSKITLIHDKSCKVAAYCESTDSHGIHVGNNTLNSSLQRVNHLTDITPHDAVYSSGEGQIFPRGFLIGFVEHITCDGIYKTALLKPAYDISTIKHCIILQKGMPQTTAFSVARARDQDHTEQVT